MANTLQATVLRHTRILFVIALLGGSLEGCLYGFSAGSGLTSQISTIFIAPISNESDRFDVAGEIYAALLADLPGRLGLRIASEETADAVLEGVLMSYSLQAPNYRTGGDGGAQVLQRSVQLRLQVMLVDTRESLIIWDNRGLSAVGTYAENGGSEEEGLAEAIELILQQIVDGAQSRW